MALFKNCALGCGTAHTGRTPGKCSPDGTFSEAEFSRELCRRVAARVSSLGINAFIDFDALDPDPAWHSSRWDIEQQRELNARVAWANNLARTYGVRRTLYLSMHVDAAGSGRKWMSAGGWTAYTTPGHTLADVASECLYDKAEIHLKHYAAQMEAGKLTGLYDRKQTPYRIDLTDGDRDREKRFYVLRNTICPAVLTENLFQDNRTDVAFLKSREGMETLVALHVEGVVEYFKNL